MNEDAPLGSLRDQRYSDREIAKVARAAARDVLADRERDAGKVYCPCCHLREARWKRHFESPERVRLFVYCTQCHKTGVGEVDLRAVGRRGCATGAAILLALAAAAAGL